MVITSPCHGENTGSIPVGVANGSVAQLVEHRSETAGVVSANLIGTTMLR